LHFAEKLDRFISNAGNPFSRSEAKNSSPRLTPWAFSFQGQEKALTMLEWAARHIGRATNHPLQITSALSVVVNAQADAQWFGIRWRPAKPKTWCDSRSQTAHGEIT
jgi:hypothetical protein